MLTPDISLEKVLPHNLEAERSVLGAILLDYSVVDSVQRDLTEDDFYREAHRTIFGAMVSIYNETGSVDLISLTDYLERHDFLERSGGPGYISSLLDGVPSARNVGFHARLVRDRALVRRLIHASTSITTECYEGKSEADDLLNDAERRIYELIARRPQSGMVHIGNEIGRALTYVEKLYSHRGAVTGVPSGFVRLDQMTTGFQESDLIIIAGRPSMGKTAFALNIAQHAALEEGIPVGIFSLEMSRAQLVLRLMCAEGDVDAQRVRTGYLSKRDWSQLSRAAGRLNEAPIYIDDTAGIDLPGIRSQARRLKAEHDVGLLVLDYLQLMQGPRNMENRQREISEISRGLKILAKELEVPFIALSQLSRQVENRSDRRPQLSDLRESGALEQDGDVIMFIYRPERYMIETDNRGRDVRGKAEIIIGKQRNGPVGSVELAFRPQVTRFENLAEDSDIEAFGMPEDFEEDSDEPPF